MGPKSGITDTSMLYVTAEVRVNKYTFEIPLSFGEYSRFCSLNARQREAYLFRKLAELPSSDIRKIAQPYSLTVEKMNVHQIADSAWNEQGKARETAQRVARELSERQSAADYLKERPSLDEQDERYLRQVANTPWDAHGQARSNEVDIRSGILFNSMLDSVQDKEQERGMRR